MTVVHIDTIHGDHLIRETLATSVDGSRLIDPLAAARPTARRASG